MSLQSVEIILDRPRHLLFRLMDLRDLCRRLGGASFLEVLRRLEQLDLETVLAALACGLRHEDPRLDLIKVEALAQTYIDREGGIAGLLQAIVEAIERSGIIQRRTGEGVAGEAGRPGSPTSSA